MIEVELQQKEKRQSRSRRSGESCEHDTPLL